MSVEKFLNILSSDQVVGYDVETNGLDWKYNYTIGYSISDGKEAVYIPTKHTGGGNIDNPLKFEEQIQKILSKRTKDVVGHNVKFDSHFSLNDNIELGNKIEDTMIAAALINENQRSFSLESVGKLYPDVPQKKAEELYQYLSQQFGCTPTRNSMSEFHRLRGDDPIAIDYACGDTLSTVGIYEKQKFELYEQRLEFVYNLENKLSHVLRKMERRGLNIDQNKLSQVKEQVEKLRIEIYQKIPLTEDFTPMNIRSNKDLQAYFEMHDFTDWEFTAPTDRHPEGQPSFNKLFLSTTEPGQLILQARAFDHFKNSFLEPIDNYIYKDKIYTNFNQTQGEYGFGTKTGRLSSTKINLQQVPKRDEQIGRIFRSIFVASPGYSFVEFDYSQAEPRLFSHYSDEPILIEGYNNTPPIDMHDIAAKYMGIKRKVAKNLNLGLQYAMGVAKLAKQLGISYDDAKEMYNHWKETFPNVSKFTKQAASVAERRGYVKTILGRRARFPDPRWAYRAANRVVQGGSADILKYKLVELDNWLVETKQEDSIKMLLNIHDAILFEIRDDILEQSIKDIKQIMENVQRPPFDLKVPFIVDKNYGKTWEAATYDKPTY